MFSFLFLKKRVDFKGCKEMTMYKDERICCMPASSAYPSYAFDDAILCPFLGGKKCMCIL